MSKSIPVIHVVNDDPMISETQSLVLRMNGYAVQFFTRPLEALERSKLSGAPDLLIAEIFMPELPAIDLAIQMTRSFPNYKVLLTSGGGIVADELLNRIAKHGFHLLHAPIHPKELLETIERLLNRNAPLTA